MTTQQNTMQANPYQGDTPENNEKKCPVVMVLDVSGSMGFPSGESDDKTLIPIDEVNAGLKSFAQDVSADDIASNRLELCIISFGCDTRLEQDFELIKHIDMPVLKTRGSTALVDAMHSAIERLEQRKQHYRSTIQQYYRPYIILITDGYPNAGQDVKGLSQRIGHDVEQKKYNFWPIGVTGADMEMLSSLACPGKGASLPAIKFTGTNFAELFEWLSSSFSKISNSNEGDKQDITPKNPQAFQLTIN
jgi:uncharacterized protein YegL